MLQAKVRYLHMQCSLQYLCTLLAYDDKYSDTGLSSILEIISVGLGLKGQSPKYMNVRTLMMSWNILRHSVDSEFQLTSSVISSDEDGLSEGQGKAPTTISSTCVHASTWTFTYSCVLSLSSKMSLWKLWTVWV